EPADARHGDGRAGAGVIDLGLAGKRALVTGAGVGIGRGIARWLASAGCDVMIADRDAGALQDATSEIAQEGTRVRSISVDLREPESVRAMVATVVEEFGGLDVAVNNVGSLAGRPTIPFLDADDDYLRDVIEQNLFVTTWCCHAEAAAMVAAGTDGVIVNVSSGESSRPALNLAPYGAAKAAINHPPSTLAVELAPHRIPGVPVAPGTRLTPA